MYSCSAILYQEVHEDPIEEDPSSVDAVSELFERVLELSPADKERLKAVSTPPASILIMVASALTGEWRLLHSHILR